MPQECSGPLVIRTTGRDGHLVDCSYKDLAVGDVLDVKLNIDIAVMRGPDTVPRPSVHFAFDEIILVPGADMIKKVTGLAWHNAVHN